MTVLVVAARCFSTTIVAAPPPPPPPCPGTVPHDVMQAGVTTVVTSASITFAQQLWNAGGKAPPFKGGDHCV